MIATAALRTGPGVSWITSRRLPWQGVVHAPPRGPTAPLVKHRSARVTGGGRLRVIFVPAAACRTGEHARAVAT
jgi:hypothetical protein